MVKFLLHTIRAAVAAPILLPGIGCAMVSEKPMVSQKQLDAFLRGSIASVPLTEPCVLVDEETVLGDDGPFFAWKCEIDVVADDDNGTTGKIVLPIEGIETSSQEGEEQHHLHGNEIESGEHTLFAAGMRIAKGPRGHCVEIPNSGSSSKVPPSIEIGRVDEGRRRRELVGAGSSRAEGRVKDGAADSSRTEGIKEVLLVRVVAPDTSTTSSAADLSDSVFGTSGDPHNLASQYAACSYNKLAMVPAAQPPGGGDDAVSLDVVDGVVEVPVPTNLTGVYSHDATDIVVNELLLHGIAVPGGFDHVMFCLPRGTVVHGGRNGPRTNWLAYGLMNHWRSVFNDGTCTSVSLQMHEIGHNLGLGHSAEGRDRHGDQSGYMGYSYGYDDAPLSCFNGPKSWQLGWYDGAYVSVNPLLDACWTADLVGVAEYGHSVDETVVLRLESNTTTAGGHDYYVNYNRVTGMNSGVREGKDQVLVTSQGRTTSKLQGKLNEGESFTIPDFDGSGENVTIVVDKVSVANAPKTATYTVATVTVSSTASGGCSDSDVPWIYVSE